MFKPSTGKTLTLICVLFLISVIAFGLVKSVHAVLMNKKLSGSMVDDSAVELYELSPDGRTTVFIADARELGREELFSVPTIGGRRVLLSAPLPEGRSLSEFFISPDSQQVLYIVDLEFPEIGDYGLYVVPIRGGPVVDLFEDLPSGNHLGSITITADGLNVLFKEYLVSGDMLLWRVPIAGGEPLALNHEGCKVNYQIAPDGHFVVYHEYGCPSAGLYRSDLDGNEVPLTTGIVKDFKITPDGAYVIFIQDVACGIDELFSIPIGGGEAVTLNGDLIPGGDVIDFQITPDSQYVVYKADETEDGTNMLYRAPVDEEGARIELIPGGMIPGGNVTSYKITPNSKGIVYRADMLVDERFDLFSVSINGGLYNRLTVGMIDEGDVSLYKITPNNLGVVFVADVITEGVWELFAAVIDGSDVIRLNTDLPEYANVFNFDISNNSQGVVYVADQDVRGVMELYVVPSVGGMPLKLNPELVSGGDVSQIFHITPDNKGVVYRADQERDTVLELFITYDYDQIFLPLINR